MKKKEFLNSILLHSKTRDSNSAVTDLFKENYFNIIKEGNYKNVALLSLDQNILEDFKLRFPDINFIDTESFLNSFNIVDLCIVTDFFSNLEDKLCIKLSKLLSSISKECIFGMNVKAKPIGKTVRPRQVLKLSYMIEDYWSLKEVDYTSNAVYAYGTSRKPKNMMLPKGDSHFNREKDRYQYHVLCMALKYLNKDSRKTAIDIGGHIGFYSLAMSEVFDKVISFEAFKNNYKCLFKNTHNIPNVKIANIALSDREEFLGAIIDSKNSGNIQLKKGKDIQARTLDSFCIGDVDLIKIDVQGFEEKVLRGSIDTIARNKPIIIAELEMDDNSGVNKKALKFLENDLNYKILIRYGKDFIMGPK